MIIPLPGVINIGAVVRSVSYENQQNKPGHYIHDPFRNPYASPYYAQWRNNTIEQGMEQALFESNMTSYVWKYGQWITPDFRTTLTSPNFTLATKNRDLNNSDFPSSAWQADRAYLLDALTEGKRLVARVKEGIFEEFGYGILDETSTAKKNDILAQRIQEFKVLRKDRLPIQNGAAVAKVNNNDDDDSFEIVPAIAYLNEAAWEALIRKLLHGMMTLDEFSCRAGWAYQYVFWQQLSAIGNHGV